MAAAHCETDQVQRENFLKVTLLLFRVGSNTLRKYLKTNWYTLCGTHWTDIPADGYRLINAGGLRIPAQELTKVFSGDTARWDFALLTNVLRFSTLGFAPVGSIKNICLHNMRNIRNELICHAPDARLSTTDFIMIWRNVCTALQEFGACQEEFDGVENDISSKPWEELSLLLNECIQHERDILNIVRSLFCQNDEVLQRVNTVCQHQSEQGKQLDAVQENGKAILSIIMNIQDVILKSDMGKNMGNSGNEVQSGQGIVISKEYLEAIVKFLMEHDESIDEDLRNFVRTYGLKYEGKYKHCICVNVSCPTIQSLEKFWSDFKSGILNRGLEQCLATDAVRERFHLKEIKLKTTISTEEYLKCFKILEKTNSSSEIVVPHCSGSAQTGDSKKEPSLSNKTSREGILGGAADAPELPQPNYSSFIQTGQFQHTSGSRAESIATTKQDERRRVSVSMDLNVINRDVIELQDKTDSAGTSPVQTCKSPFPELASKEKLDHVTASPNEPEDYSSAPSCYSRKAQRGICISVSCPTLQSLDDVWRDYISGLLNEKLISCLLTEEVVRKFQLKDIKLETNIPENKYYECRKILEERDAVQTWSGFSDAQQDKPYFADLLSDKSSSRGNGFKEDVTSDSEVKKLALGERGTEAPYCERASQTRLVLEDSFFLQKDDTRDGGKSEAKKEESCSVEVKVEGLDHIENEERSLETSEVRE